MNYNKILIDINKKRYWIYADLRGQEEFISFSLHSFKNKGGYAFRMSILPLFFTIGITRNKLTII